MLPTWPNHSPRTSHRPTTHAHELHHEHPVTPPRIRRYHWEMTEDAMRHSIVPGSYMRWKNAGMDRFGRAAGANKLS